MNSIVNITHKKWTWACQNKLFWANLALVLVTTLIFIFPGQVVSDIPSDYRIRAFGMALQLLGAYTVWHNLTGTAREFGETGIWRRTWTWLKAGFSSRGVIVSVTGCAVSSSIGSVRATVRPGIDENATIDHRVAVLERYVVNIDSDVTAAFAKIGKNARQLTDQSNRKAIELQTAIHATETRLKKAMVGNYTILLFGAVWLFIGIVLASLAPEIAKIVGGQYQAVWAAL